MNRGLTVALLLSLAVNIFLGGYVAGRFVGGPSGGGFTHPPRDAGMMMSPHLDALSPEGREAFRKVFEARHDALRERHRLLNERRAAFAAALAADPWDRAKAETALADLKAATDEQESAFATLVIDAFENLSAADRRALAEAVVRGGHWRRHRMHHRRHDGLPPPPPGDEE